MIKLDIFVKENHITQIIMYNFKAPLEIIGVNPYVSVPSEVLLDLMASFGKSKGMIPVTGTINNNHFTQTIVKFSGQYRLYINTSMLKNSPRRIGEMVQITLEADHSDRAILPHPELEKAIDANPQAKKAFENLTPSRQKEIVRYITNLKSEKSRSENIIKAINHLTGKSKFAGRNLN